MVAVGEIYVENSRFAYGPKGFLSTGGLGKFHSPPQGVVDNIFRPGFPQKRSPHSTAGCGKYKGDRVIPRPLAAVGIP